MLKNRPLYHEYDDDCDDDSEPADGRPGPGGGDGPNDTPPEWADVWDFSDSNEWDFLDGIDMVEEMFLPCPTLRKIPQKHLKSVSAKIGNIARHATSASSVLARERALKFFFFVSSPYVSSFAA